MAALSFQIGVPSVRDNAKAFGQYHVNLLSTISELMPFLCHGHDSASVGRAAAFASQSLNMVVRNQARNISSTLKNHFETDVIESKDFFTFVNALQGADFVTIAANDSGNTPTQLGTATLGCSETLARGVIQDWLRLLLEKQLIDPVAAGCMMHLVAHGAPAVSEISDEYMEFWEKHSAYDAKVYNLIVVAAKAVFCVQSGLSCMVAFQLLQIMPNLANHGYGTRLEAVLESGDDLPSSLTFDGTKHKAWGPSPDVFDASSPVFYVGGPFNEQLNAADTNQGFSDRKMTVVHATSRKRWDWDKAGDCGPLADLIVDRLPPTASKNGKCECCGLQLPVTDITDADNAVHATTSTAAIGTGRKRKQSLAVSMEQSLAEEPVPRKARKTNTALATPQQASSASGSVAKKRGSRSSQQKEVDTTAADSASGARKRAVRSSKAAGGATTTFDPRNLRFGTLFQVYVDGSKRWYDYRALWYFHGRFNNEKGLVLVAHPEGWADTEHTWIFLDSKGIENMGAKGEEPTQRSAEAIRQAEEWYNVDASDFLKKTAKSWGIKRNDLGSIKAGPWIREGGPKVPPKNKKNWSVKAQADKVKAD